MIPRYPPITYYPVPGHPGHFPQQNLDDAGKIFVGGIPADATKETLTEYFSQFGEVSDSIIMLDNVTGRSRGFGFVTFLDQMCVDDVLAHSSKHSINGKVVDAKKAVPKGPNQSTILKAMGVISNRADRNPDCKVFVGGVAQGTTETDLANYFKIFGKVLEVKIPKDQNTQRARGFSFVLFDNAESVIEATKERYHTINNKTVEVKTVHLSMNIKGGFSDKSSDDGQLASPPSPFMQMTQQRTGGGYYAQYPQGYIGLSPAAAHRPQPYYEHASYEPSPSGSSCSVGSMGSSGLNNIPTPLGSGSGVAPRVDEYSPYMAPAIYQAFNDLSIGQQQYQRRSYPVPRGPYAVHAEGYPQQGVPAGYSPTPMQQSGYSQSPVPSSLGYQHAAFGTSPPVYQAMSATATPHAAQQVPSQYPVAVSTPQPQGLVATTVQSFKR